MSQNDDLIKEIPAQIPCKRGPGRPRKEKRRKPSVKNKRVKRATTENYDIAAAAYTFWRAAIYLEENLLDSKLNLHFDFKTSILLKINTMKDLAKGLALHLEPPNVEAFRNVSVTEQELSKAEAWKRQQMSKALTQVKREEQTRKSKDAAGLKDKDDKIWFS